MTVTCKYIYKVNLHFVVSLYLYLRARVHGTLPGKMLEQTRSDQEAGSQTPSYVVV